jgi:hypothetical protein
MIKFQNSVFIDTENCGSAVGYYITTREYTPKDKPTEYTMSASVVLSDCSHKIDWNFGDDSMAMEKIDAVIGMLQEFRKKLVETEKIISRLNK